MRANYILFVILAVFFLFAGVIYVIWNIIAQGGVEWAGTVGLFLSGMLGLFLAFYLHRVHGEQGAELPEDRLDANVDDRDPEIGHFSPWSWWPILLGAGASLVVLGLAIGFWITFIGIAFTVICLVGWTYEYYRGYFAR
jgi:disulfide bond formation protein DsbB